MTRTPIGRTPGSGTGGSGTGGFSTGDLVSRGLPAVREVLGRLRSRAERRHDDRPKSSDIRAAVLTTLAGRPATGYEIVRLLQERGDVPTPGAGAVYPTLQLLADEGLATATEEEGRRTWTLTSAGTAAAEAARARPAAPLPPAAADRRRGSIARSGALLAQAAALAAQTAPAEQIGEVVAVLDRARREVLAILARG